MSDVPFLPAPPPDPDAERTLIALADERMVQPAREAGYELRLIGATVLPQRQVIARTASGVWYLSDQADDPTAHEYDGRIPVPERQAQHLLELSHAGVKPELIWIAHQLPDNYRDGDPLPPLVPAPPHLREKDERLKLFLANALRWLLKAMGFTLGAAMSPLALMAGIGLDPVILGGVRHPKYPVVTWCVLAQWEWE